MFLLNLKYFTVSHPEEIWGHRFQLGVLGSAASTPPHPPLGRALVGLRRVLSEHETIITLILA